MDASSEGEDVTLELSTEEADLLKGILTRYLDETRREIRHTDTSSFKETLKSQEAVISGCLHKLAAA